MVNIPHNVYIESSPEQVYRALTTNEGWASWISGSDFQLNENGEGSVRLNWKGSQTKELIGEIEDATPGQGLAFSWQPADSRTVVSFALEPYKNGTLLAFEETGFSTSEADMQALVLHAVHWGEALNLLKVFLEHNIVYTQETIDYDRLK